MALVETGTVCACAQGHLLGEGPGWLDQGWARLEGQSGGPTRSPEQDGDRGWEGTSHLGTKALPGAWLHPGLQPGPRGQEEVRVSGVRHRRSSEARLEGFLQGAFWQASTWRSGVGAFRLYISAPFLRGHG